jgi:hypothetical protein
VLPFQPIRKEPIERRSMAYPVPRIPVDS